MTFAEKFTRRFRQRMVLTGALVVAGFFLLAPGQAAAQSQADFNFLQDRLGQLEGQVQALRNGAGGGASSVGEASIVVRLDAIEEKLRNLTGLAEQNAFQVQQLEDRLRRLAEDTEFRFQELGQGGGARSSVQPQYVPQPVPQQGLNLQPLPPVSTSRATIGSSSLGPHPGNIPPPNPAPGTLGTLQGGPVNINPIAQSGSFQPGAAAPIVPGANAGQVALGVAMDPRGEYDVAYAYILQRDFEAAEVAFTRFLQNNPNTDLTGNAKYWLGETFFARGQYREAADAFLKSYTEHRDGRKAPDSLLKLGMSLNELGQTSAACSTYSELVANYPNAGNIRTRAIQARQSASC